MPPCATPMTTAGSERLTLERLGLDADETMVITLLRHFLASFSDPHCPGWQRAFVIGVDYWGAQRGPLVAVAALSVVQALRAARPCTFRHADPLCPVARRFASAEEATAMRMLQAMRAGLTGAARAQVARLTGGRIDPALFRAGLALAGSLPYDRPKDGKTRASRLH